MTGEIRITRKARRRGDDGYKVVSVRMKDELIARLDDLSVEANRSRNELINLLLESAVSLVKVEEAGSGEESRASEILKLVNR